MTHNEWIDHLQQHAQELESATKMHGLPVVLAPKVKELGLEITKLLAAQKEHPDYSLIVKEIVALGKYERIRIDNTHNFLIGCTAALDPHTYLCAPAQTVVDTFRTAHTISQDAQGTTVNGLPEHIRPIESSQGQTLLPLHFVTWCFVEDTTETDEERRYKIFDALSLLAHPEEKLTELGCSGGDIGSAVSEANIRVVELTLRNKEINAKIYNEILLNNIVQAVLEYDKEHLNTLSFPPDTIDRAEYIRSTLRCDPQFQRVYRNIGNSPKEVQARYDSGRGPATLAPWHEFTRFVPMDRFAILVGRDQSTNLTPAEYDTYRGLMQAIAQVLPGSAQIPIDHRPLHTFASDELATFIKSLDTLSDYVATYSLPVLTEVLRHCCEGLEDTIIERSKHTARATSLAAEHGKSMRIRMSDALRDNEDEVAFGVRKMSELLGPLQSFTRSFHDAYTEIFDRAGTQRLTETDVKDILTRRLTEYHLEKATDVDALAHALSYLKPTSRVQEGWDTPLETPENREAAINALHIVIALMKPLINDESVRAQFLNSYMKEEMKDGATLYTFYMMHQPQITSAVKRDGQYVAISDKESDWQRAVTYIQHALPISHTNGDTAMTQLYACLVSAVYGIERRGIRIGTRSENLPAIPGMIMSYRVLKGKGDQRVLECELSIALGQRASFEAVTGALLNRLADAPTPPN